MEAAETVREVGQSNGRGSAADGCGALPAAELGWPIERAVSLLAGGFTVFSLVMARVHHPRWRLMTGLIGTNLVLQAVTGWCPASLLMRRLGLRTAARTALDATASQNRG